MVWNTPGNGGDSPDKNRQNPWPPRRPGAGKGGGGGLDGVLERLREVFGGGNGGGIGRWILLGVALLVLLSSFQLVGEQQRGVVLRFGQFARVMQPGPNLKWPWPVERVIKVNATQIKTFSNTVPVLTRDENIVSVTMNVQYRVGDPRLYLFGSRDADRMLEQVAQSVVREQVGRADLDTVLGARGPLSVSAGQQLQASLDAYRTGLVVTELNLQDARPPEEVKPAFDEVNSAQQIKDQLINEARAYAARVVPEARGEAARRLQGRQDRPGRGRRGPLQPAPRRVPQRAGSDPQAPVAGDRAGRAVAEPKGRRRRQPPADLRADARGRCRRGRRAAGPGGRRRGAAAGDRKHPRTGTQRRP